MEECAHQQYRLVQSARGTLLAYCATLATKDFTAAVPAFNQSNMRGLLVHVASTYQYWLGTVALGQSRPYPEVAHIPDVVALGHVFEEIDNLVALFTRQHEADWLRTKPFRVPGRPEALALTPLALFTHVITHEFHHKGQLLTMSRLLGYTPIDTDVVRF
jgi:uncharacterized damage-inducible protein DinB